MSSHFHHCTEPDCYMCRCKVCGQYLEDCTNPFHAFYEQNNVIFQKNEKNNLVCDTENTVLCRVAGSDSQHLTPSVNPLREHFLCEKSHNLQRSCYKRRLFDFSSNQSLIVQFVMVDFLIKQLCAESCERGSFI